MIFAISSRMFWVAVVYNCVHGLTSLFDTIFYNLIISYRELCLICRRKPFLRHTTDGAVGHSGGKERQLLGTDRDAVPKCKAFVRSVVVFLAFYRVY